MDALTLALIGLRAAALALDTGGRGRASEALYRIADLAEAGGATEEHMRLVAEKLKKRALTDSDIDDVLKRIREAGDRLHDRQSAPPQPQPDQPQPTSNERSG